MRKQGWEKKDSRIGCQHANARRRSGVEYAQILVRWRYKMFGHYGGMMESSMKLESSLYISFCYGGIVENVLNITFPPSSSLSGCYGKASPGSYGRQEILLGYIHRLCYSHFLSLSRICFSGRTNDWLLYSLIRTSRFILFTSVLREHR